MHDTRFFRLVENKCWSTIKDSPAFAQLNSGDVSTRHAEARGAGTVFANGRGARLAVLAHAVAFLGSPFGITITLHTCVNSAYLVGPKAWILGRILQLVTTGSDEVRKGIQDILQVAPILLPWAAQCSNPGMVVLHELPRRRCLDHLFVQSVKIAHNTDFPVDEH